jgi:hypothetical protein
MWSTLKELIKQPFWIIALIAGVLMISFPCITFGSDHSWTPHAPSTWVTVIAGGVLLLLSVLSYGFTLFSKRKIDAEGLDYSCVKEAKGVFSIKISECEISVIQGRIEEQRYAPNVVVVLPCNEYFDDRCAHDTRSALGAYANRVFGDQTGAFASLIKSEAKNNFGQGEVFQKTVTETGESFGSGKCLLLLNPLGRPDPVALISTTTQRAGQGLTTQISCLFVGMHELNKCLADARINEAVMPVLGAGHGGLHKPLALTSLLLAVAEAARYGYGAQRLKKSLLFFSKKISTAILNSMRLRFEEL